jgi:hypothetical protein
MKAILVLMFLGLPTLLLFPVEWRVAIAVGWVPMMGLEAFLSRVRHAHVRREGGGTDLLMLIVFGFLGRLGFLVVGAVLGAKANLYPEGPFMASCLAALVIGEALSLTALARASRRRRAEHQSSADSTPAS